MSEQSETIQKADAAVEYLIMLDGTVYPFGTGGFESIESLESVLDRGAEVEGAFYTKATSRPWNRTKIRTDRIIAIIDVRESTEA